MLNDSSKKTIASTPKAIAKIFLFFIKFVCLKLINKIVCLEITRLYPF
jgi:hypothetical protein